MSRQKQNLLWLLIICCSTCQITSEKLIIQVESTDECFWNESNSPYPDIKWKCLTAHEPIGQTVRLNISSLGQCRSYSFNITKQAEQYELRMNDLVEGIKLWLFTNDNCLSAVLNSSEIETCQAQGGIMSISNINLQTGCQNIGPVDPEEKCRNAQYNNDICSECFSY
ncbi:3-isopropylmalate dehydrogenase [Labeo rohita]|uniref:3-isopropylmalate dehydrogenase n=1 Tax=Labeo rohita TaxID=84645 RepID=A0ABQ8L913_LABRO|nr:3-isopropylmalate dehydrogenase [Labeo rohita]